MLKLIEMSLHVNSKRIRKSFMRDIKSETYRKKIKIGITIETNTIKI